MNAKEKANELVFKYVDTIPFLNYDVFATAKKCALICVDEILKNDDRMYLGSNDINYWEQVKQEIEKL